MASKISNTRPKKQPYLGDKPINNRRDIEIESCFTEREYREGKIRFYLAKATLPLYIALLVMSLSASIYTGNESYLRCFDGVLKYVTPLVMFVYGYYFYTRAKADLIKR